MNWDETGGSGEKQAREARNVAGSRFHLASICISYPFVVVYVAVVGPESRAQRQSRKVPTEQLTR
jgi:hypothetical protein